MISSSVSFVSSMQTYLKYIDTPMSFLLLAVGIFLSIFTKFPQVRNFRNFIKILKSKDTQGKYKNTLSPTEALFTAMSTSLGMGCIAVPSIAIAMGGPGALFWLVVGPHGGSRRRQGPAAGHLWCVGSRIRRVPLGF